MLSLLLLSACSSNWAPRDEDGDGVSIVDGDCADTDPDVHPGAAEACDGVDQDCDGVIDQGVGSNWYQDADGDGFGDATVSSVACAEVEGAVTDASDCDDAEATVHPGAEERCDTIDSDCDGSTEDPEAIGGRTWYADTDGDGYGNAAEAVSGCEVPVGYVADDTDCNDDDTRFHPGATEDDCDDPADYNCDGSSSYSDLDGDGWVACRECDDGDAAIRPDADEVCNEVDDDCDTYTDEDEAIDAGTWYADADEDGYGDPDVLTVACDAPLGFVADATDCDDDQAAAHPGADEVCDGFDDDCDGQVDEDDAIDATEWYADDDQDGYGDASASTIACDPPTGFTAGSTDCDDTDTEVNPGEDEVCDEIDNDCDSDVDEDTAIDASDWYADTDGDGYGDAGDSTAACDRPSGYVATATDCDDTSSAAFPGGTEVCDSLDNDCDGAVDNSVEDSPTWYADVDNDGYGGDLTTSACTAPTGYVSNTTDCDDGDAAISPVEDELCDGVDNDCDGDTDEDDAADAPTWYADTDGDGYGGTASARACSVPTGYVSNTTDCDDSSAAISPADAEVCDGEDNDCDGTTDEASATDAPTWYADTDGDGYGGSTSTRACTEPADYVSNSSDCDEGDASVNPAAVETCDSIDNDCDTLIDEAGASGASTWYPDSDGDGYGASTGGTAACSAPSGYVSSATDCDDGLDTVYPSGAELCDGADNDCDGSVDEGLGTLTAYYADSDGDAFGDPTESVSACAAPADYVTDATDCDDDDAAVNTGATEVCNHVDDDCDGAVDLTWFEDDFSASISETILDRSGDASVTGGVLQLTQAAGDEQGSAVVVERVVGDTWHAEFDFATVGGDIPDSGEGFTFFFLDETSTAIVGASGGDLGLYQHSPDYNGYAVELDTRTGGSDPDEVALRTVADETLLDGVSVTDATDGAVHTIEVDMDAGLVTVTYDGSELFSYEITGYVETSVLVGWTAATTGGHYTAHEIDNAVVSCPP